MADSTASIKSLGTRDAVVTEVSSSGENSVTQHARMATGYH